MKVINLTELKAHLSKYLRMAARDPEAARTALMAIG
jgi:hypothetical protein